jgi:hypothetical protein
MEKKLIPGLKHLDIPLNPNGIGHCPKCGAHFPLTEKTCKATDCDSVAAELIHF